MSKSELMKIVNDMSMVMGKDKLLLAVIKLMDDDELYDTLDYINSCYDLDFNI